jgi:hypothetical protein
MTLQKHFGLQKVTSTFSRMPDDDNRLRLSMWNGKCPTRVSHKLLEEGSRTAVDNPRPEVASFSLPKSFKIILFTAILISSASYC